MKNLMNGWWRVGARFLTGEVEVKMIHIVGNQTWGHQYKFMLSLHREILIDTSIYIT